jgi:uncharacterized protein
VAAHAAVLEVDLHMPYANSLKAKRAVLRPIVEGLRNRFHVAVAEVDHQDLWQRSEVAVAAVAGTPSHVTEVLDACERFVWAQPGIEVLGCSRRWVEDG